MNTNTKRMVLAAIAAFYVVVGGLWASYYFPLKNYENQSERQDALREELGYDKYYLSKEYQEAEAIKIHYAVTSPSYAVVLSRIALFETLLFWATVALGAGGCVLFLTRDRSSKSTPASVK